jgi:hypothetical protein
MTLKELDRHAEALASYDKAIAFQPAYLAPRLRPLAIHGVLQSNRPAGDRPAAGEMRRRAGADRDWIPDRSSARRTLRRRSDAVSTGRAAREGAAVVRSQTIGRK